MGFASQKLVLVSASPFFSLFFDFLDPKAGAESIGTLTYAVLPPFSFWACNLRERREHCKHPFFYFPLTRYIVENIVT